MNGMPASNTLASLFVNRCHQVLEECDYFPAVALVSRSGPGLGSRLAMQRRDIPMINIQRMGAATDDHDCWICFSAVEPLDPHLMLNRMRRVSSSGVIGAGGSKSGMARAKAGRASIAACHRATLG